MKRAPVVVGRHYRTGKTVRITLRDGKIASIRTGKTDRSLPWVAPGLIDLQVNGYAGTDYNATPPVPDAVPCVTVALAREAVTTHYPTVITNAPEAIERIVAMLADHDADGIHLEGPFICGEDGPRGSHPKKHARAADRRLFDRWQKAAKGKIRLVTLAPEREGSIRLIRHLVKQEIKVAIGHTAATGDRIRAAVEAGAGLSTHLGNGAHATMPRHPNYILEQLAEDRLWASLIADGIHLPDAFLKIALRMKGTRAFLVSDAVHLGGMQPGTYETHIGGKVTLTGDGALHMEDNPKLLAGAAAPLLKGVEHLTLAGLATLADAWDRASIQPAAYMGMDQAKGLAAGGPADLVLFDCIGDTVRVRETWKAGNPLYRAG